jgi:hypothetical protein
VSANANKTPTPRFAGPGIFENYPTWVPLINRFIWLSSTAPGGLIPNFACFFKRLVRKPQESKIIGKSLISTNFSLETPLGERRPTAEPSKSTL